MCPVWHPGFADPGTQGNGHLGTDTIAFLKIRAIGDLLESVGERRGALKCGAESLGGERVRGYFGPFREGAGIFRMGDFDRNVPGGRLRVAWIEQPGTV